MIRILVLGLLLASCAPAREPASATPVARVPESITYETGPCFGTCPVYRVSVGSDGAGTFTGVRFTAVTGDRAFRISPADYDALVALLAPHLPDSGTATYQARQANCRNAPTDMPSVRVTRSIQMRSAKISGIYFYVGCGRDNPKVSEALGRAFRLLPITDFIGKR